MPLNIFKSSVTFPPKDNLAFKQQDWIHFYQTYSYYVKPTDRVLEIGASNPDKTIPLAGQCHSLIGVEKQSRRLPSFHHPKISIINCSWEKIHRYFPQNHFDIVVASHVIEHVPNDLEVLKRTYQVLKPGGVVILNTPNRTRLVRRLIEIFTGPRRFPWWEHFREYSYSDLDNLLRHSPFSEYHITPVVLGLHSGNFKLYSNYVPPIFKNFANYWEIVLIK